MLPYLLPSFSPPWGLTLFRYKLTNKLFYLLKFASLTTSTKA